MKSGNEHIPAEQSVPVDILERRARQAYQKRLSEIELDEQLGYRQGERLNADWLIELDATFGVEPGSEVMVSGLLFHETDDPATADAAEYIDNESLRFDGAQQWHAAGRPSQIGFRFVRDATTESPTSLYAPFGGLLDVYQQAGIEQLLSDTRTDVDSEVACFANMKSGRHIIYNRIRRTAAWRFQRAIQNHVELEVATTRLFRLSYDTETGRPDLDWFDSSDVPGDRLAVAEGVLTRIDYIDEMLLEDVGLLQQDDFVYDRDGLCMVMESQDDEVLYFVPLTHVAEVAVSSGTDG